MRFPYPKRDEPEEIVIEEEPKVVCKMSTTDYFRMKIEKMFENPEKALVSVEQTRNPKLIKDPPEFVRNVWGSAAGVGSGDFHIYRGVRRREYLRREINEDSKVNEKLDEEFKERVEEMKRLSEEKTAKKRAKRQKRKDRMRNNKKKRKENPEDSSSNSDDENVVKEVKEL